MHGPLHRFCAHLLVLAPFLSIAQPEHRNWYFGYGAALEMNGTAPVSLGTSAMQTDEGVASISDDNGGMLFYTNGESVWNSAHALMPNGTGLAGHFSSSQSALIVPVPDNQGSYYIFTTPAQAMIGGGVYEGLAWSMVDMSLSGGLGDVTLKNIELEGPVVEKLSATRHANGRDVWVVAHGWNNANYYAYLVTCSGIQGPVISEAGRPMVNDPNDGRVAAIGCMKISPQGDRIASVWTHYEENYQHEIRLDVLDFDNFTGVVSNAISDTKVPAGPEDILQAYGVSFSPNGQLLYCTENGLIGGGGYGAIAQYDLASADPMSGEVTVATTNLEAFGSLQLHEGRMYVARLDGAQYISCITQPDLIGAACGMVNVAASIAPGIGTWGLPNNWDTFPQPPPEDPIIMNDTTVCDGNAITLEASWEHPFHTAEFLWSTGDTTASITVMQSGIFSVQVMLPCSTLFDTVTVSIGTAVMDLGADRSICEGDSVVLEAPEGVGTILWSDGSTGSSIILYEEGNAWAEVATAEGCVQRDSIHIELRNCLCPFFLPNAFTPNGDGINDRWGAAYDCEILRYQLVLFDRWGRPVLETDDPTFEWAGSVDGVALPATALVYTVRLAWDDGRTIREQESTGHVTLVR